MRRICDFNAEERASIEIAKEKLIEITPLTRHLARLAAAERKIFSKLEALGYRRESLSQLKSSWCKPYGTSIQSELHMCKLLDELIEVGDEKIATETKLNRIINAIFAMPTEKYKDILIKKYLIHEVLSTSDRQSRHRYLNNAYLEFFSVYFEF